ncbi:MAG: prolyl-tRNA synthetase associated domain-containing protein [Blautia sp.]
MSQIKVDPTRYRDKPTDGCRLPKEMAVYELLEQLKIPYVRVDHEVTATIEECEAVDRILDCQICKNLFLCNRQKTDFYLLLMPGEKPFKTKDLSRQIGSARLSFAEPEFMEEFLNITPGSVSIMGLMNDTNGRVKLLIDREVAEAEEIAFHPCINTTSMKTKTRDILEKFLPYVKHEYQVVDL